MNKLMYTIFISLFILAVGAVLFLGNSPKASATAGTVQLRGECDVQAEDASHMCVPGLVCVPQNDLSEGNGKCQSATTPTPTVTVTLTPSVTPSVTPTATPTATPTTTPTQTPSNGGGNNGGGDGKSDGLSSCPQCTQAPSNNSQAVLGASTQAVLGASTFAGTGTFDASLMNSLFGLGTVLLGGGYLSYRIERK